MAGAVRGIWGEAAVLNAFAQRGFAVLVPFGEGQPYDLVVDISGVFLRIQCKMAWPSAGCLLFNAYSTDHGRGPLSYLGRADVFGVYLPANEQVYVVPVAEVRGGEGRLRLEPARNNQKRGVRFAERYELARWSHSDLAGVVESCGRRTAVAS